MANNRGIVSGWDVENNRAKGVTSPAAMRTSLASLARAEGIMAEPGAATLTRSATRMGISWTAFTAVIASPLGGWLCPRIGDGGIDLTVGDATYPRIDVVYVRQWDYETAGDHPDSEVEVGVVKGTPSATPSTPATPTGALVVWTITVPKGAVLGTDIPAGGITACRRTTPLGGTLTAASQSEANALVNGVYADASAPLLVNVAGSPMSWNGTEWSYITPASVVLFSGDGSTSVKLSESAANFSSLSIEYRNSDGARGSVTVSSPNGKAISTVMGNASTSTGWLKFATWSISGTSISNIGVQAQLRIASGASSTVATSFDNAATQIWITKVIGVR